MICDISGKADSHLDLPLVTSDMPAIRIISLESINKSKKITRFTISIVLASPSFAKLVSLNLHSSTHETGSVPLPKQNSPPDSLV